MVGKSLVNSVFIWSSLFKDTHEATARVMRPSFMNLTTLSEGYYFHFFA